MKKRLLSWILCLCIVVCMMPMVSLAAEVASGMCGDNVTWSLDSSGTLTISGTGDMYDYWGDNAPWSDVQENVKQVVIESGVTSIGELAFYYCGSLTSVTIPEGMTSIGYHAFYQTGYYNDASNWRDGILYCGNWVLEAKEDITDAKIPNGIVGMADNAFVDCSALTSVTIPNSVTSIGYGAFQFCSSLTSVTIPNSVTSIGGRAFAGCSSLTSITIPNSVTSIEYDAFRETGYYNDESNWKNNILYCGNWVLNAKWDIKDAKILNGVTGIAGNAFGYCGVLESVTIPESVTSIGAEAFISCRSLTSLTIPASVTSIGAYAFGHKYDENWYPVKQENFTAKVYGNSAAEAYCKEYGISYELISAPSIKFTDVDPNQYYAVPVAWAVENGITAGTSSTTFSPELTCTRGQIMTFLWKAAGSPEPKSSKNPFTDIDPSQYYYKPILWAVEHGITSGTSSTTFSPDQGCTRGQVMTFLWRNAGSPIVSASNPFTDVKPADYYSSAVLWAVSKKITAGTSPTTFSPDDTCTRGQIVTFLYRNMA